METRYTLAYTSPLTLIIKILLSSNFTVLNTNYKLLKGAGLSSAKLCMSHVSKASDQIPSTTHVHACIHTSLQLFKTNGLTIQGRT